MKRRILPPFDRLAEHASTVAIAVSFTHSAGMFSGRPLEYALHDVVVAGAPAEIAVELVPDLRLRSARVALEDLAVRAMIMPGVQKPHCSPCFSSEALLDRMELAVLRQPSIVVTLAPSACTASIVHDFTAWPPMRTGARAALARVAADVGPGQTHRFPDVVHEQESRLHSWLQL